MGCGFLLCPLLIILTLFINLVLTFIRLVPTVHMYHLNLINKTWTWQKIRGKPCLVHMANSFYLATSTCQMEMVENGGCCGLFCQQMQQFCPCQHCDILKPLTWAPSALSRFLCWTSSLDSHSVPIILSVCLSIMMTLSQLIWTYLRFSPWKHF